MAEITHPEMVAQLAKTGADIVEQLSPKAAHLLHMAVGVSGEVGELLEAVIDCETFEEVDMANLVEELGDAEFYLEGFRQGMGFKREVTIDFNDTDFSMHGKSMIAVHYDMARLSAHAGKLLDQAKKMSMYCKPIDAQLVMNALKDIELYLESIRNHFGITHEECLEHNVDKLGKRYKGHSYSNEQAINRADKAE